MPLRWGRRVGPSLVYSLRFPSNEESMVGVEGVDTPARRSSVTIPPDGHAHFQVPLYAILRTALGVTECSGH